MRNCLFLCLICTLLACATGPPGADGGRAVAELRLTAAELVDATQQTSLLDDVDPDDEVAWQVYVPTEGLHDTAPGLIVFISPSDRPGFPPGWLPILDEKNLVLMAPIDAGNRQSVTKRVAMAVSGLLYFAQRYELDRSRFYLSGFSGGARVSGVTMALYPKAFTGAIYVGGAEVWPDETPAGVVDLLGSRRFVFITGASDFNREMTRRVWGIYGRNGIDNAKLEDLRHLGHELPGASVFERSIGYLDGETTQ